MPSKINSDLTRRRMLMAAAYTSAAAVVGLPRLSHAETLAAITKRGFMTVATEDDYRPFEFMKDGKPTGYDQELLEMMKKKTGLDVHQDIIPWTGILPGVSSGKYDAAVTAILVTAERILALDFTSPVAASVDYYLKRKGDPKITSIKDLAGKPLGVEAGSAMLKLLPQLEEMLKATGGQLGKIVPYQGYPEAYQDLSIGRVDYVVNTFLSLDTVAKERPTVFELGEAVSKPTYIAWAVQKGNTDLLKLFNDFLLGARKDGSMYALQKKWFDTTFENMSVEPVPNV
jgi:polar amino acid transport system substrate-binding protein